MSVQQNLRTLAAGFLLVLFGAVSQSVSASTMTIVVDRDASLASDSPAATNFGGSTPYLYVGDNTGSRNFQAMLGFNVDALTSLVTAGNSLHVNSMLLQSYNNFNGGSGYVQAALGNTDNWTEAGVSYANSADNHGASISQAFVSSAVLNQYVSWDVTAAGANALTDNGQITFYLYINNVGVGTNWHDFEQDEIGTHKSKLVIDYNIVANVPEPATLALLGLGLIGIGFGARRKKAV